MTEIAPEATRRLVSRLAEAGIEYGEHQQVASMSPTDTDVLLNRERALGRLNGLSEALLLALDAHYDTPF